MNFRQGFFRIWVVGSVLFIGAVAAISYDKVSGEFSKAAQDWSKDAILMVPVDCKEARGTAKVDYSPSDGPWSAYSLRENQCWYRIDALRRLYPKYKDLSEAAISDRLYKKAGIDLDPAKPWTALWWVVLIALGIPAFVLVLGAALGWALSGFFTSKQNT